MSGSDGPPGGATSWDVGGDEDDCSRVVIDAALDPPDADESFAVGNEYDVVLVESGTVETIQVLDSRGTPVGAVRPHQALLRCLRKGVFFFATVTGVQGASVTVRIRPRA